MTTAIIGVGLLGSALARNLVGGGEAVVLAARNEDHAARLANDVARRIETEMEYPGQIKVTVIRETRVNETAK